MPTIQSDFSQQVFSILPGQLQGAFAERDVRNHFARGLLRAGLGAFKVQGFGGAEAVRTDPGEVFQIPSPGVAVDVDAIGTGVTSATATNTIGAGVTAGVVGSAVMQPARRLTVTFDASTDWDPSTAVITFLNNEGARVSENLAVATSTTATTVAYARQFISLTIPAQTGTGGTATIGIAAMAALTVADFMGIVVRQPMKSMVNPSNLYIGPTSDGITNANTLAHYVDGDTVPCLRRGHIGAYTEEAVSDMDPVFVRVSASGAQLLGAFRNDADSATCVAVTGARFVGNYAAGVAEIKLGLGY